MMTIKLGHLPREKSDCSGRAADSGEAATDHAGCLQVNVERQAKLSHADSRGEATDELGETNLKRKRLQVIGGNKSDLLPGVN